MSAPHQYPQASADTRRRADVDEAISTIIESHPLLISARRRWAQTNEPFEQSEEMQRMCLWIISLENQLEYLSSTAVPGPSQVPPGEAMSTFFAAPGSLVIAGGPSPLLSDAIQESEINGASEASAWGDSPSDLWSSSIPQAVMDTGNATIEPEQAPADMIRESVTSHNHTSTSGIHHAASESHDTAHRGPSTAAPSRPADNGDDSLTTSSEFSSNASLKPEFHAGSVPGAHLHDSQPFYEFVPIWDRVGRKMKYFVQETNPPPHALSPSGLGPFKLFDPFTTLEAEDLQQLLLVACTGYCWVPDAVSILLSDRRDLWRHAELSTHPDFPSTSPCGHYLHQLYNGPVPNALKAVHIYHLQCREQLRTESQVQLKDIEHNVMRCDENLVAAKAAQADNEVEVEDRQVSDSEPGKTEADGSMGITTENIAKVARQIDSARSVLSPQPSRVAELRQGHSHVSPTTFTPNVERTQRRRSSSPLASPPVSASEVSANSPSQAALSTGSLAAENQTALADTLASYPPSKVVVVNVTTLSQKAVKKADNSLPVTGAATSPASDLGTASTYGNAPGTTPTSCSSSSDTVDSFELINGPECECATSHLSGISSVGCGCEWNLLEIKRQGPKSARGRP